MKTRKFTVSKQLRYLVIIAVLFVAIIVCVDSLAMSISNIKKDYQSMALISTVHLRDSLENGNENWEYDEATDTVFCNGEEVSVDLFDTIHATESTVYHTIFYKDTRVLTNIKDTNGNYAVGTTADENIYANVKAGNTYTKNGVKIFGAKYTVC